MENTIVALTAQREALLGALAALMADVDYAVFDGTLKAEHVDACTSVQTARAILAMARNPA